LSSKLDYNRNLLLAVALRALPGSALQIAEVAVAWQIYVRTGSAVLLGMIGLVEFLPSILLVPLSGVAADRYDRCRLSAAANGLAALAVLTLVILERLRVPGVWPLLVGIATIASCRVFAFPSHMSLLATIVPRGQLRQAIALSTTVNKVAMVSGPSIGGLLLAFGVSAAYALAFCIFVFCVLAAIAINAPPPLASGTEKPSLGAAFEGMSFVLRSPVVLAAISLDFFSTLLGGMVALLPIYVHDILRVGPEFLGFMRSAPAVGSVATAMVLSRWVAGAHAGRIMLYCVAAYGAATILFGISTNVLLSLVMLICLGAADTYSTVVRQTLVQLATPDSMRGRVNAVSSLCLNASSQLGQVESGMTATWFGTVPAVIVGGVGSILVALLWSMKFPTLAKMDLRRQEILS
jgi:MFS family permease